MIRKLRILLADDDEVFTMLVRRALSSLSDRVDVDALLAVSDGSYALDYLHGEPPYDDRGTYPMPDLVLLDQRMNRMDGTETLAAIKCDPALAGLPVCILSTSDETRLKATCYSRGASFFVRKSLDYHEMKEKLQLLARFFHEVLEVAA